MADTKISALTALADAADEDLVAIVDDPSGTPATKKITLADLRTALAPPVLHVRDEKAGGTHGGNATGDTWNTRDLNTVAVNEITGASLASNQITLPAGTYQIRARAQGHTIEDQQIRFRNITDGTSAAVGMVSHANVSHPAHLEGRFTIAAQKTFELQHWADVSKATNGFGNFANSGEVEVYAEVWLEKVA